MWNCLARPGRTRLVTLAAATCCASAVLGACGGSDTIEPSQPAEAAAATVAAQTSTSSASEEAAAAETGSAPEEATAQGFELGFAYGLENTPIYQNVLGPAKVYAQELGVDLTLGSADSKCDKQLQDLENMIAAGVRAITFLGLCGEGGAYDKVVNEAHAKDIAVVSYAFEHPLADGSILFDDQGGAELFAAHATAWIEENFEPPYDDFSYAALPCSFAPPPIQLRTEVVVAAIEKLTGKQPYASIDCALSPDLGKEAVDTYLQKDPGLDMALGIVDAGAYGAYLAFKQAGKGGDVYVGGMDGTREAIQLIAEQGGDGIYKFSGALPMQAIGKAVVEMPYNIVNETGPGSILLNYTAITADDQAAAKQWYEENFEAFDDAG